MCCRKSWALVPLERIGGPTIYEILPSGIKTLPEKVANGSSESRRAEASPPGSSEWNHWSCEIMAPDTNGKWIEVPLSDDASHETVESITKSIVRKKGVWDSRII